jgi:hypothetical protein
MLNLLPVPIARRTAGRFRTLPVLTAVVLLLSACGGTGTAIEPAPVSGEVATSLPANIAATATSPADPPPAPEEDTAVVSFSQDVLPILQSRCLRCHGGEKTEEQLNMTSYEGLMAGSEDGVVVVPGDADNSPFVQLVVQGKMPKRSPRLLPEQIQVFIDWVNAGALNN